VVNHDGEGVATLALPMPYRRIGGLGQLPRPKMIDCKGLHILPGVIDTQSTFDDRGQTHKED